MLTAKMFKPRMSRITSVIQIAGLYFSFSSQNPIRRVAAEISAQRVMAHWYPRAVSRNIQDEEMHSRTVIPANSETKGGVNIAGTILGDSARKRKPCCHFTETLHHTEDGNASEGVAKKHGKRPSFCESASNTQEQTGSDSTAEGNELDVSRLEAGTC